MKHSHFPLNKMRAHLFAELQEAVKAHNGKVCIIEHDESQGELSNYYIEDGRSEEIIVDEICQEKDGSIVFKGREWRDADIEIEGDCEALDFDQLDELLSAIPETDEVKDVSHKFEML